MTPFEILVDEFLEGSVRSFVILDRDDRSETARPVSPAELAEAARVAEIDPEAVSVFDRVEALLDRR